MENIKSGDPAFDLLGMLGGIHYNGCYRSIKRLAYSLPETSLLIGQTYFIVVLSWIEVEREG